ncbi:MAG TPA: hypothetical protein VF135_10205 [Terriglobales bacterium]
MAFIESNLRRSAIPSTRYAETRRNLLEDPAFLPKSSDRIRSPLQIWLTAISIGTLVFLIALALQWVIYDRFLHEDGVRIVGSAIAAIIATILVQRLETAARNQRLRERQRLEVIALLNHHIRNALQVIVSASGSSDSTNTIRLSAERIEWALGEVLPDLGSKFRQTASSTKH